MRRWLITAITSQKWMPKSRSNSRNMRRTGPRPPRHRAASVWRGGASSRSKKGSDIAMKPRSRMSALASANTLIARLQAVVGPGALLTSPSELLVYECDGFTIEKNRPDVVVFPTATEQVVGIVQVCNELD